MKEYLIFGIFLFLIKKKNTTAKEVAKEFEISSRSVYRYIDALSLVGVPVVTKLGRGGGIQVIGEFKMDSLLLSDSDKIVIRSFLENLKITQELLNVLNKLV